MLTTLARRLAVSTLDAIVDRGQNVHLTPVRWAASALDTARGWVGLDEIDRDSPLPNWTGTHPEQPMWESDLKKLRKWQVDQGIVSSEADSAPSDDKNLRSAPSTDAPVVVFFKRGCPYTRAALDLLREREIEFESNDITMDEGTQSWLRIVTGRKLTPQIFIHGEVIGGFDELRALDQSGELRRRLGLDDAEVTPSNTDPKDEIDIEITVAELRDRIADGADVQLLDCRTEREIGAGVIEGAVHIPLESLATRYQELDLDRVWIVYCHLGQRSQTGVEILLRHGARGAVSLTGGVQAWCAVGGDLVQLGKPRPVRLSVLSSHPERSPFEDLIDIEAGPEERLEDDALLERVAEVLDECRPMVQADGGDIELLDIRDDIVHLQLTGNCIGCPSSQATLRHGIERRLKARIPQLRGIASPQLGPT